MINLHDSMLALMGEIEPRIAVGGVDLIGMSTGIAEIDDATSGLRDEAVYLVGARPGMGKTALALSICAHATKIGKKSLFVSMEMGHTLLSLRILAGLTDIPAEQIEKGRLTPFEVSRVRNAIDTVKGSHMDILDGSQNSETFTEQVRQYQEENGLDFLAIDYVALFRDAGKHGENERLTRISNNITSIARDRKVPILLLAQLNRNVDNRENHMPQLSDYRESGSLEQDAFVAGAVMRPFYYRQQEEGLPPLKVEEDAKFIVMKNRQGRTGSWTLHYHADKMLWTSSKEPGIIPSPPPTTGLEDQPLKRKVRERGQ